MAVGATVSLSSGYHPQSNGQTECTNQTLETALRCVTAGHPMARSTCTNSWCLRHQGCRHSSCCWTTNRHPSTTRRTRLLPHLCRPIFAADEYGSRFEWPSYAPLCRPRGKRTATGDPHQCIDVDKRSGCPPGTSCWHYGPLRTI